MKYLWYKIKKSYKGGFSEFQIKMPNIPINKDDWDELFEYIGENTDGGHSEGYSIKADLLKKKDTKLKVYQYPSWVVPQFEGYGKIITYTKEMI